MAKGGLESITLPIFIPHLPAAASQAMNDSFDLHGAALPKEFGMGCLRFENAHLWRLSHVVWEGSAKSVDATFFCDLKEPWDDRNLLRVEVFRLPAAAAALAERLEWYTKHRKQRRIKIADGALFDDGMLHPKAFGPNWEAESFALSKGEIIRVYRTQKHAVIFRFLARSGTLLDHPVFKRAVKNLSFDASRWETKAPEITERRKQKKPVETPFSSAQERELRQIDRAANRRLGLTKGTPIAVRLETIEQEISRVRELRHLSNEQRSEMAAELGVLVGQCFCSELGWEWRNLNGPDGDESVCVCCPERRLVLAPGNWALGLIASKKQPINCALTFNMIAAGRLPPTRPHAYIRIN